jgi:D-lactate dehydrogenase
MSQKLKEILSNIKIFDALSPDDLPHVEARLKLETYEAGSTLCVEGGRGDRMFLIESGEVAVLKQREDGANMELTRLGGGDIAGEMSLFGEMVRSATLRAETPVRLWSLDYHAFDGLLQTNPAVARSILAHFTRHLHRENSLVARLLGQESDRRFRVAFFDSKPYMEEAFRHGNPFNYAYRFFDTRLDPDTVAMAAGSKAVCVFVNDKVDAEVLDELHAMGVEMIALRCAGFNNVDVEQCERLGLSVARVPAYSPYAVAEHAVALMMTLNRRIHRSHIRVREGNFALSGLVGFDMHGKTVGVLGAGKIGQCALRILRGFGCRLLVYEPMPSPDFEREFDAKLVSLETLFRESDIISLHAPLMPATRHVVDSAAIGSMKAGVMLINTSRGALIDTRALLDGLRDGKIGYAGLDVYEEESAYFFEDTSEKVMTDDVLARLLTFNNVIVTGHQAFLTQEALQGIAQTTVANLREFELGKRGRELTNAVLPQ